MLANQDPTLRVEPVEEIDVSWLTADLSCDGETIALIAASQPSMEELILGAIPWSPKVRFHNPFLSYENGDEFLQRFYDAAGELHPSILVVEGFHPGQIEQKIGLLGRVRNRFGQRPADRHE